MKGDKSMIEASQIKQQGTQLRYGMVGGGEGSFIGDVHRKALQFDGKTVLVAGCFSQDYENTKRTGRVCGIPEERLYTNYKEMAEQEATREDGIQFVVITTPNYAHYGACKAFLEKGIHVVCEKPLTVTLEEGEELVRLSHEKDLLLGVTYVYSGCPMARQAREIIKSGKIGKVIHVMGEYPQGWLAMPEEKQGSKQAEWRTNPKVAGGSNCMGDIGTHIEHTVAYMTGLKIKRLLAKLDYIGEDRVLDTNGSVIMEYENGATGVYWASQVAIGYDNALRVRIFGEKGSIDWEEETPDRLKVTYLGEPTMIMTRGNGYNAPCAKNRIPSGHPEGYYEAFANVYEKFIEALEKKLAGEETAYDFPTVEEGLEGVKFIQACIKSTQNNNEWIDL